MNWTAARGRVAQAVTILLLLAGAKSAGAQPAAAKEAPSENAAQQLAETVGLLAGLQLYQTYLNIGFIADGKAEGIYVEKDVRQLLASVLTSLDTLDKQMEKVGKLVRAKEDRDAVDRLRKLSALLRQQGKQLETFWASGKEADGARYETTRKQAWEGISALLGLDKQ